MIGPMNKMYRTIYADPPWPEHGGGKIKRGADRHYDLMSVKQIINLSPEIQRISDPDGCHLYLWVTNNYLPDGLLVMREWGFEYKTNIAWVKDRIGLGQYFRGQHELCLFGVRGKVPYKTENGKRCQCPTVISAKREEHSKKPLGIYQYIEKVSYPCYIELFARGHRDGWDCWGNEATDDYQLKMV